MRCRGARRRSWRGSLGFGLLDVDAALEQGAVFDADTRRDDVADQLGILADINFIGGDHVALHLAEDDDFPGSDVGLDAAVRPDGDLVVLRFDGAFDVSIDVKIFLGKDLAVDFDRLANHGVASRLWIRGPERC